MRHVIMVIGIAMWSAPSAAVEYKCKGKDGQWDAANCTGAAKPVESDIARQERELRESEASRGTISGVPPIGTTTGDAGKYMFCMYRQHVNTTQTSAGTHEQWVCGGGRYLYFQNGILTSVQDTNR